MLNPPRRVIALTVLATTSIFSEATALMMQVWRNADGETRVMTLIGLVSVIAFVTLLLSQRVERR